MVGVANGLTIFFLGSYDAEESHAVRLQAGCRIHIQHATWEIGLGVCIVPGG